MDKVQEQAIQSVMGRLNLTANDINRYIADAVLEHELVKAEVERLRTENAAFKADIEAGRLVRLPFVPHDKVWYIDCGDVLPGVVTSIEKVPNVINPKVWRVWGINASGIDGNDSRFCRHMNSRFREEVFATEEEARAALEKEDGE